MAIYPFSNAYVINKDAVVGSSFKAGMVLMQDANGQVKPADSQSLIYKSAPEKQSMIIGIAAGDSNITGNTIIVPDYIGSNYLDSNSNFVSVSDREYVSVRRQLLDYADETVNDYYNINYSPKPKRTGIGIYSLSGDLFATDQFAPVLHGDFGLDGTITQSLNPGDLLTFGGGINAGKLVKINTNSVGPDVVIIGIVDKYNSTNGLLYFREASGIFDISNNTIQYAIDVSNPLSYTSGTSVYDLSGYNNTGTLYNGVSYSNLGGGSFYFDGSNDYIRVLDSPSLNPGANLFTMFTWVKIDGFPVGSTGGNIINNKENLYEFGYSTGYYEYAIMPAWLWRITGQMDSSTWKFLVVSCEKTIRRTYINGSLANTYADSGDIGTNTEDLGIGARSVKTGPNSYAKMYLSDMRIYFSSLTDSQVLSYYNYTKTRYGL